MGGVRLVPNATGRSGEWERPPDKGGRPAADLEWLARTEDLGRQRCPPELEKKLYGLMDSAFRGGAGAEREFEAYLRTCAGRYDVSPVEAEYHRRQEQPHVA